MSADGGAREYVFGPFRLEVDERRLLRDGEEIALHSKAFDTLVLLVVGAGTLQKQQVLIDQLWPDVVVEPNNLQQNISILRRALADAPGVEIETVRGQGYRLRAEVRVVSREAPSSLSLSTSPAGVLPPDPALQRVQFCRAEDGTRLAFASLGEGRPLVKVAHWLSHLELDWQSPIWTPFLARLSRGRRLIRYDARGNGLSDWNPSTIRFTDFVDDLAVVMDAAQVERAPLFGISQGAAVAVAYAARHPERVSALILFGGCVRGWRVKARSKLSERMEALMVLMRQGWGADHAVFRHLFTSSFFPAATREQIDWFNELQRRTTTPDNASSILSALGDVDVRDEVKRVRTPTLVLHCRGDAVVPFKDGLELASAIASARFVALDSDNHILLQSEPAWTRFHREIEAFTSEIAV